MGVTVVALVPTVVLASVERRARTDRRAHPLDADVPLEAAA
jgi:hypothetical protein